MTNEYDIENCLNPEWEFVFHFAKLKYVRITFKEMLVIFFYFFNTT